MTYFVLMLTLFVSSLLSATEQGSSVRITVSGITEVKGTLRATLDGSAKAFKNKAEPVLTQIVPVSSTEVVLVFENVSDGTYAVKIFQDENEDEKLNQNLLGIPSEKYGISNDARGKFGLPPFEEASFTVSGKSVDLSIAVKNHALF